MLASPAFIVLAPAKTFAHPTQRPNELCQTDFIYLRVVGWRRYYLSTVRHGYSRYIVAGMLRTSMRATDVMETLDLARARTRSGPGAGADRARLLSDNRPRYCAGGGSKNELEAYPHTRGWTPAVIAIDTVPVAVRRNATRRAHGLRSRRLVACGVAQRTMP